MGNNTVMRRVTVEERPECYFCKKKGHLKSDCWHLKNATPGSAKPTMTTVRAGMPLPDGESKAARGLDRTVDEYTPFISNEVIHPPGSDNLTPVTIIILRYKCKPTYIVREQNAHVSINWYSG